MYLYARQRERERERKTERGEKKMMEKGEGGERNGPPCACGVDISVLPEGCISDIVALTTPKDACRSCAVSSIFRAAAESNAVWESFLPSDYQAIIAQSSSSSDSLSFSSKKQLYLSLSDNPILIDGNKKVLANNPINNTKLITDRFLICYNYFICFSKLYTSQFKFQKF